MCYVSEGGLEFDANPSDLFFGCGKSIGGCSTSSIGSLHTMIDFANRHQVLPQIEIFPVDKINEAIEKIGKRHAEHIAVYGEHNDLRLTGRHETGHISQFSSGVADRGASIRIPRHVAAEGRGYLEDRRPASNIDPYRVTEIIVESSLG